jgi:hypothetical protein
VADVEALLERHLLQGILEVSWIHPATGKMADDTQFFSALQELMAYAFEEYARHRHNMERPRLLCQGAYAQASAHRDEECLANSILSQ